jgi:hypothetical protein
MRQFSDRVGDERQKLPDVRLAICSGCRAALGAWRQEERRKHTREAKPVRGRLNARRPLVSTLKGELLSIRLLFIRFV